MTLTCDQLVIKDEKLTMAAGFTLKARVYYEDTDAGGVVFYANYLKFLERARTEWLRDLGFEQDKLMQTDGVVFAVTTLNMDFLKPARFNDLLEITVELRRLGKASFNIDQEIFRGSELLNQAQLKLACVDTEKFSPQRIPDQIFDCIKPLVIKKISIPLEK